MNSIFIPEEKAGSIICQRAEAISLIDSKRKRIAAIKECAQFLRSTHIMGKLEPIHVVAYGCAANGDRGLIVLYSQFDETVSGPLEPPNG
jgi:hypothetical protein